MTQPMLTEIPSSLKQLARLVVRGFYEIEYSLIIDMLVRYPCMREDDLCDLLKFDKKILRAKLATLKSDRFVQVKLKIETGEDGKAVKVSCFFINYKIFVNIVKYKLDLMRKRMEVEERDATSRSSFRCTSCNKQFSDLEADQLFDMVSQEFKCTFCGSTVEEDESAMPKKDSRLMLAKFNEQMEKLFELLRVVEDIRLAPEVLEPDPVDIAGSASLQRREAAGPASGDMNDGRWTGEASRKGGFRMEEQEVNITFGEKTSRQVEKKEVPLWIAESTVQIREEEEAVVATLGPGMAIMEEDQEAEVEQDDEITNLLLKHEKSNKQPTALIPGDESDSDNRSDESEPEDGDTVERDALLLAQTFAAQETAKEEEVEMMDDDDDDDDDIPTIMVGDEVVDITDVTEEIIARMTTEEMERYNQVYQEFYKDMIE